MACLSCKDALSFFRTTGEMRHLTLDRRFELCFLLRLKPLPIPLSLNELVFHSFLFPRNPSTFHFVSALPLRTQVATSLSLWRPRLTPPTLFVPPFVQYSPAGTTRPVSWGSSWLEIVVRALIPISIRCAFPINIGIPPSSWSILALPTSLCSPGYCVSTS